MAERNAARVFPEPVGAAIKVWRRAWMDGQARACGSVGVVNCLPNQAATAGWKRSSGIVQDYTWKLELHQPEEAGESIRLPILRPVRIILSRSLAKGQPSWKSDREAPVRGALSPLRSWPPHSCLWAGLRGRGAWRRLLLRFLPLRP